MDGLHGPRLTCACMLSALLQEAFHHADSSSITCLAAAPRQAPAAAARRGPATWLRPAPRPPREAASWSEGLRSCGAPGRAGRLCLHRVPGCSRAGAAGEGRHCLTPSPSSGRGPGSCRGAHTAGSSHGSHPRVPASPGSAAPGATRCAPRGAGSSTAPGPRPLPEQRRAQLPVPEAVEQRLGINDCVYEARNVASKISHSAQRRRANGRLFMALPCCCRSSAAPAARPRAPAQDPPASRTLRWSCPAWGAQGGGGSWRQTGALPQPPRAGAAAGAAPGTHGGAVQDGHHPCRGAWRPRQPCPCDGHGGAEGRRERPSCGTCPLGDILPMRGPVTVTERGWSWAARSPVTD